MLKISVQYLIQDSEYEDSPTARPQLVVNGKILPHTAISLRPAEHGKLHARIYDPNASSLLTCHKVRDLLDHFSRLDLTLHSPLPELSVGAILGFGLEGRAFLHLTYYVSVSDWRGPWSITDYNEAIHDAVRSTSGLALDQREGGSASVWQFACDTAGTSTGADLNYWIRTTSAVIEAAKTKLRSDIDRDTLVTLFDFPPHVSTACEQYLLYFVQFLRDLGIEAGASIKHDARQVLFSVTPSEGAEGLDRIREALDIYLRLPDSPEFAAQAPAYVDIAVQQLQANIFHLNGQLAVAGAVLEAKNARIEALQLANFTYQQLLATQQQVATIPLLPPVDPDADVEPLVPGVIEVTRYEGKGFTVNLPELLRRLKRRFDQE